MKFNIYLGTILIILNGLVGCKTIDVTGHNLKQTEIDYVQAHKLTKQQIIENLGTPTLVADYSPNIWYYIYIKTTKSALTLPTIIEQNIFKITFDDNGRTIGSKIIANNHNNNVAIINTTTVIPGTDKSSVNEFVKNIGRFNTKKKKK